MKEEGLDSTRAISRNAPHRSSVCCGVSWELRNQQLIGSPNPAWREHIIEIGHLRKRPCVERERPDSASRPVPSTKCKPAPIRRQSQHLPRAPSTLQYPFRAVAHKNYDSSITLDLTGNEKNIACDGGCCRG